MEKKKRLLVEIGMTEEIDSQPTHLVTQDGVSLATHEDYVIVAEY